MEIKANEKNHGVEFSAGVQNTAEKEVENTKVNEPEKTPVLITAGDRTCYLYFDTEFTGLQKDTSLISIGIVDCDGRSFYAEFTDYNMAQVSPWILENVLKNLQKPETILEVDHWTLTGTTKEIQTHLVFWLDRYLKDGKQVQFVSDVCHFDFVLLLDLLLAGHPAIELPDQISACCVDINQDIATSLYRDVPEGADVVNFNANYIPAKVAFDISREEYVSAIPEFSYEGIKHNSLYDAMVIRAIHQNLWNIEK